MKYPFRNFVFEGGGVKGIAYVGAMEVFEEEGIVDGIERVGGTSAGAINAVLLAFGYSNEEVRGILWELTFTNFLDDSWGLARDLRRLKSKYGWYKGDFFKRWIKKHIAAKTGNGDTTFAQLEAMKGENGFKSLALMGTDLTTRMSKVFSFEETPDYSIAEATRISMSIPLFFKAVTDVKTDSVYVDGGILANYPIKLFDRKRFCSDEAFRETDYYQRLNSSVVELGHTDPDYVYNKQTLGFRLDEKEDIAVFRRQAAPVKHKISDFFDYAWGLIDTFLEHQQNTHLHSDDWSRTVYIDTLGVGTTDFEISTDMKEELINSGRKGAKEYLAWYNSDDKKPNGM